LNLTHVARLLIPLAILSGCGLPASYSPAESERFWSVVSIGHWLKGTAATSQAAVVTWRSGKDAELPRSWSAGPCVVTEGTWRNTAFTTPTHGAVAFTGAAEGAKTLTQERTHVGYQASGSSETTGWKEGSEIKVEAPGGGLPGFSFTSTVDSGPALTTFDLATAKPGDTKIPRSAPLALAWTPRSGEVLALLLQYDKTADKDFFHGLWCILPATSGAGAIPVEALGSLADPSLSSGTDFYFGSAVRSRVTNGPDDVDSLVWNGRGVGVTIE